MTCPSCEKEPLAVSKYIWKPQAITLVCSGCGTKLRMAPSTFRASAGLTVAVSLVVIVGTILTLRYFVKSTPLTQINLGLVVMIAFGAMACCVIGPIIVRLIIWRMPYVPDPRK